jgi:hypothetical protein
LLSGRFRDLNSPSVLLSLCSCVNTKFGFVVSHARCARLRRASERSCRASPAHFLPCFCRFYSGYPANSILVTDSPVSGQLYSHFCDLFPRAVRILSTGEYHPDILGEVGLVVGFGAANVGQIGVRDCDARIVPGLFPRFELSLFCSRFVAALIRNLVLSFLTRAVLVSGGQVSALAAPLPPICCLASADFTLGILANPILVTGGAFEQPVVQPFFLKNSHAPLE